MPSPYSDNLYSSEPDPAAAGSAHHHDDAADAAAVSALSPSDGYFREDDSAGGVSPTSPSPYHQRQPSSHASRRSGSSPYVPNVLVEDPSLAKDPDSKTQIAQRLINSDVAAGAPSAPSASHHPHHNPESYYPSASPSVSGASVATPSTITTSSGYPYAQSSRHHGSVHGGSSQQQQQLHINTSAQQQPSNYAYQGQGDAPPAYTPSSPDNNPNNYTYSTFPSTSPRMGVPEEHDRLLSPQQQQQAYSDPPKKPLWWRIRESHDSGSLRNKVKKILGILVFVSILLVFMGFNMSGPSYRVSFQTQVGLDI